MLWRSPLLSERSELVHGFTGRAGGVSVGSLAALNLAMRAQETQDSRDQNWRRVLDALGMKGAMVGVTRQVHGDKLVIAETLVHPGRDPALIDLGEADASMSRQQGVLLATFVADCVPVLLAGPRTVAAVHAGWKGTALGIVAKAARAIAEADDCRPDQLIGAVGPCIGACCYEVGEEVAEAVSRIADGVVDRSGARPRVDLGEANRRSLISLGLTRVDRVGECTRCSGHFFSHRGQGELAGRQVGIIGWR